MRMLPRRLTPEDYARYGRMIISEGMLWLSAWTASILAMLTPTEPWVPKLCGLALFLSGIWSVRIKRLCQDYSIDKFDYIYRSYRWICSLESAGSSNE